MNVRFLQSIPRPLSRLRLSRPRRWNLIPWIEPLENRQLLSTVDWTNPAGGSWDVASNWSTGKVPGPTDDVDINMSGNPTVTISSNVESIHSIATADPLVISGGGLTVAAISTIGDGLTMTGGSLTANGSGVTFSVTGTTTISGASLYAQSGATLSLSQLTSYTEPNEETTSTLQASGTGSVLSLPALTSIAVTGHLATTDVQALSGGDLKLPLVAQLSGSVDVESEGASSTIHLSSLTGFNGGSLTVTSQGTVEDSNLTTINGVGVTLDGTGTLTITQWVKLTNGSVTVTAGSYTFAGLTDIDGSSLYAQTNASLTLPGLTTYTEPNEETISTLQASGTGSVLSLPALTSIAATGHLATTDVQALSGGDLKLPLVAQLSGSVVVESEGSVLSFPELASIDGTNNGSIEIQAHAGGDVEMPALTQINGLAQLQSDGAGGLLDLPDLTSLSGSGGSITVGNGGSVNIGGTFFSMPSSGTGITINVPQFPQGVTVNLASSGAFTEGTTFNIPQGDTVNLTGGTFTGGMTFNVAQDATINVGGGLTGSQELLVSGSLTGSGAGTVQFVGGLDVGLDIGLGGLTLNFPGSMFQWASGTITTLSGNMTNLGTVHIVGGVLFLGDGVLDNFGTIVQNSGGLEMHSDNVTPTTLLIEKGASYVIASNSYISSNQDDAIINAGTISKTAGTGTSTINVTGPITNTGTIEAESGTLLLDPTSFSQLSGGTLTGGTWNALNGSTLAFPSGTSITTNQANIALSGTGATIASIQGLSANSGSLSLTDGASFSTTGDFSNTGSLTLGAGSTLAVDGNYSQGSSATLTIGIGGSLSGNDFGQLNVTGSATLAGSVNATTPSNFTPAAGDSFPIVTYASETGGDSLSFTGVSSGAVSILQPVIGPINIVLSTVTSPANLVVQPFSVAANAVAGQNLTLSYQVDNKSGNAASGDWTDSVYLSTQPTLNSSSVLLGRVQHTGGVAANGQYSETLTAPVPGLAPDNYDVIVLADSLGLVPELNRTNTELASTNPVQVTIPALTIGSPASGTIDNGQDVFYQVNLSGGQDVEISAGLAALRGGELYVGYQTVPTTSTFEASSTSTTQTTQQIVIPDTQAGTYFILLQGDTGSTGGQPFTLSAQTLPLQVTSASPSQAGNSGTTTLTVQGAEFTAQTSVSLVPHGGGSAIAATQVTFQGSTTLFAQFNLSGQAAGVYDLVVKDGTQTATDPSAFTVTSNAAPGHILYNLSVPSISRPGRVAYLTLTYTNDGGSDAPAPLFVVSVTSGNATIGLPGQTSFSGSSVQMLGIENTGPAGTLPPGYQGTLQIPYESTTLEQGAEINFSLQVLTGVSTPMNWSSLESSLQPPYIPSAAWPAVFANLTASFGSTTASYLAALDNEATYLSQLGEYTDDVQRLFGFAINIANDAVTNGSLDSVTDASFPVPGAIPLVFDRQFNSSISGRDTMGPFGVGWTDNWQISASADSQGNVTISDDGSLLYFAKNSDGSYADAPGEYGTLTLANGAYQYVQTDGTILAFNPNGTLDYEQDTNGNRITEGYNASGELTSLTAANGSAITIAYNAQGLVSSISDPSGQTTTYSYDPSGQHLLTFTDEFGKTTYTYATGPTAADAIALSSITFADGTGIVYTYDAEGRLATQGRLGGAETETYAYPAIGEDTVTDADGNTTAIFRDDQGNLGTLIDPLGNITRNNYDADDNLVKTIAADGTTTTYTYDANGNMTSETDPLGYSIHFTYNSLGKPLTFVNQEGYTTTYQYDANGNLIETTNPDGTTQQYVYNTLGEVTSSTDADGQTITYAYNTNAQLTAENLPGGTSDTYTYDSHGNMLTAKGPGGNWSFTYNSQNLPTTITEPNGTLTVQYGIDGNITQMVDQTGFTVNYLYDSVGRLSELTDASGNLIESYSYDPAGNVVSETKGNGTSTTYAYNADGAVTQITNLAQGGAINSQMTYVYDALGQVSSMTTGGVTTTYGYDADGELISASSPGDTIQYAYDPAGNRTSVTDNGVFTNYTSNDVNEYTQVGDTTYQYDANGNLIAATTNGQTTTYTFNALNQLTGVNGPTGAFSYTYDPLGYQISSTANGQTTNNLIDPFGLGNVAAQFDSSGNLVAEYTYGLGLVSQVTASGLAYYYDYNLQGSTVGITNASRAYVNQYSYDPFGQVTTISAGIANPFTFVGQAGVSRDGNGLIYMRARYYDSSTGQFLSNDPLGLGGGDTNTRRYIGGDPIGLIDPSGLCRPEDWRWLWDIAKWISDNIVSPIDQTITKLARMWTDQLTQPVLTPENSDYLQWVLNGRPSYVNNIYGQPVYPGYQAWPGAPKDDSNNGPGCSQCNPPPPPLQPDPPPAPPPPVPCVGCSSTNQPPHDPNDLLGPSGYGAGGFLTPGEALGYTIEFSNQKTAEVPADNVVVTEQLSPNLDWSTFQLGTIGFGSYVVNVPPGLMSYSTRVDATATLGVYVDVDASLNLSTGLLTVTFTSLDPTTLDTPSNPLVGFLPPDTNPPNGEGYINYAIQPKAGLATGATINAQASIVFDTNAAIATPQITNTIDAGPPSSSVAALPATETSTSFSVTWSGEDDTGGSGIASYNIYVSDDGGPFTAFETDTTATSATFTGVNGNTYDFYSVATDNVGNVQPTPASAQATTLVDVTPPPSQPAPPVLVAADDSGTKGDNITDDASPAFSGTTQADATVQLLDGAKVIGTATADASGSYVVSVQGPLSPGTYQLTVVATNSGGPSVASNPLSLTIVAPPATPNAPTLLPADSNGSPGGETTTSTSPYLVGTTLAGATVQLLNATGTVVNTTQANSAGGYQIAVPGPLGVGSYAYKVAVIDQYGDASSPSAAQTITVVNLPPPPLVTMTKVQEVMNKKHQVTEVIVTFSGAVNASEADQTTGIYRLVTPGKKGSYTAKNAGIINLRSAVYNQSTNMVALTPKKPFALTKPVQLQINGLAPSGLQDSYGRLIDGDHNGTAGGNAIAILSKKGATIDAVELVRTHSQSTTTTAVIDALLERGELAGLRHRIRNH